MALKQNAVVALDCNFQKLSVRPTLVLKWIIHAATEKMCHLEHIDTLIVSWGGIILTGCSCNLSEEYLSNVEIQMGRLFLTEASQLLDILPENVLCTFMSTSGWIRITLCFRSSVVNQVSNVAVYVVLFLLKIQPSCYLIMLFWQQWNQQKESKKWAGFVLCVLNLQRDSYILINSCRMRGHMKQCSKTVSFTFQPAEECKFTK